MFLLNVKLALFSRINSDSCLRLWYYIAGKVQLLFRSP